MTTAASPHSAGLSSRLIRSVRVLGLVVLAAVFAAGCASSTTTTLTETDSANQTTTATEAPSTQTDEPEAGSVDNEPTAVPAQATAEPEPVETDSTATDTATDTDSTDTDTDEAEPTETETETASSASSVFDDGDFCSIARDLDENDPFSGEVDGFDFDVFSEDFFTYVIELYDGLAGIAPDEIADDIGVVRAGMVALEQRAAEFDYNLFDPGMVEALSIFETTDFEAASINIEAYLSDVCGIDPLGATTSPSLDEDTQDPVTPIDGIDGLEDEDLAILNQLFLSQFDLDPELQACLLEAIPDLTQAVADPAVLQQEVCGTTLFAIFQGLG